MFAALPARPLRSIFDADVRASAASYARIAATTIVIVNEDGTTATRPATKLPVTVLVAIDTTDHTLVKRGNTQTLMVGRIGPMFRQQMRYNRHEGWLNREETIIACRVMGCGDEAGVYFVDRWPEDGWEFCPKHENRSDAAFV